MIAVLRIDERLIHGQIAVAWSKTLKITHIIVANDDVVNQELQKVALKMAVPGNIKLGIFSVDDAIKVLSDKRLEDKRILIVVKRAKDARKLVDAIPDIPCVNVGNSGFLGDTEGVKEYTPFVKLSETDIQALKAIEEKIPVEIQLVPDSEKRSLSSILGRK